MSSSNGMTGSVTSGGSGGSRREFFGLPPLPIYFEGRVIMLLSATAAAASCLLPLLHHLHGCLKQKAYTLLCRSLFRCFSCFEEGLDWNDSWLWMKAAVSKGPFLWNCQECHKIRQHFMLLPFSRTRVKFDLPQNNLSNCRVSQGLQRSVCCYLEAAAVLL